jgi:hypothetical protein
MAHLFSERRFTRLLIGLLGYLFLTPFIPQGSVVATLVVQGGLTAMLFLAASAVQKRQHSRSIAMGVMAVAVAFHWLGVFQLVPYSADAALVFFVLFYALLIYAFFKQLLRAQNVNAGVILVSLCLYLIIGLFWGSLYTLLQRFCGDAFSGVLLEDAGTSVLHLFNYFSIVTLTTLGYGDITPQIPAAASLCQMEAIVGQFYTAVLVAWLVGMYGKPVANEKK